MHVIEHHIQREIIDRLMRAKHLRFKELKPEGMESNIFMYHLKQLIRQEFVAKTDGGYTLAPKGLTYVDNLSSDSNKPKLQPKAICIIMVKDKTGKYLLAERKTQPFIGLHMLLSGKQRIDETIDQHIARELQEKLNVVLPYQRRGVAEIVLYDTDSQTLLTHVVGQVYEVSVDNLELPQENNRFRYAWHEDIHSVYFLPGTKELVKQLESTQEPLFFSYTNLA